MIQPPRIVVLEDILKRRLPTYEYSEDYHRSYYGYLGEVQFLKEFPVDEAYVQLFNMCIEYDKQRFEIDRLVLTGDKIFAFDVKNYFGNFQYDEYYWKKSGGSIKNPEPQFVTMDSTFSGLIDFMNTGHSVHSNMIFINKGFSIDRKVDGVVKYYDIGRVMKRIGECAPAGSLERKMAHFFTDIHRPIELHQRRPNFNFKKVKSGIQCTRCGLSVTIEADKCKNIVCKGCLKRNTKMELVRENLVELEVLLDRPITLSEANKWIGRAQRNITKHVLERNFNKCERGFYSFEKYYNDLK
ncbi:NERD domain-containing protein [Macrococcus capreoli]|uniref:NERD domain-containing protein n=1 Tax=Macrococcus capreoli TaxID=2982690 RepID=UPI003F438252